MKRVDLKKLDRAITQSGMKRTWLAQRLDMSIPTLRSRLYGEKPFTVEELLEVCEAIGRNVEEFLYDEI